MTLGNIEFGSSVNMLLTDGKLLQWVLLLQRCDLCFTAQKDGVCPDSGFAGKASANNVKLLGCMTTATAMLVVAQRPLKASDKWDRNWSVTKAGAGVWAYGPVSDASPNAETPVVLYHG